MRCPSCGKMCSFSTDAEPEVTLDIENVDLDPLDESNPEAGNNPDKATVSVSGTATITLTSECCGDDMKSAEFNLEEQVEVERGEGCTCDLENDLIVGVGENAITEEQERFKERVAQRGPLKGQIVKTAILPRYQKRFYGVAITIDIICACRKTKASEPWTDRTQASDMDELT